MPSRGYRKGISDDRQPRPHVIKSRVATATYAALHAEADARSMTFSALVDRVLDAHVSGRHPELPHPRGHIAEALRELARVGNNVNQIAQQANMMRLHLLAQKAADALDAVTGAARRLVA